MPRRNYKQQISDSAKIYLDAITHRQIGLDPRKHSIVLFGDETPRLQHLRKEVINLLNKKGFPSDRIHHITRPLSERVTMNHPIHKAGRKAIIESKDGLFFFLGYSRNSWDSRTDLFNLAGKKKMARLIVPNFDPVLLTRYAKNLEKTEQRSRKLKQHFIANPGSELLLVTADSEGHEYTLKGVLPIDQSKYEIGDGSPGKETIMNIPTGESEIVRKGFLNFEDLAGELFFPKGTLMPVKSSDMNKERILTVRSGILLNVDNGNIINSEAFSKTDKKSLEELKHTMSSIGHHVSEVGIGTAEPVPGLTLQEIKKHHPDIWRRMRVDAAYFEKLLHTAHVGIGAHMDVVIPHWVLLEAANKKILENGRYVFN